VVGFCTSREVPLIAAMVPEVPGIVRGGEDPAPGVVDFGAVVVVEADDAPQAARVSAATPRTAIAP
jgi:hypothetical protein